MAIDPSSKYPSQIDTSDPTGYPYGAARNQNVLGDGTGTPFEADLVNDIFGFQQALLEESGISPSGNPEKVGASQYLEALFTLYGVKMVGGELVYVDANGDPAPKSRTVFVDPLSSASYKFNDTSTITGLSYGTLRSVDGDAVASMSLLCLPDGAEITGVRFRVQPGGSGDMTCALVKAPGVTTPDVIASDVSSGTAEQWVDLGALSETVDRSSTDYYFLRVSAGGSSNIIRGYEISFNDPGPRNF